MYTLLVVLALVSAFFLVIIVLAQNSKGGGLSNQFGGSGASNLIGVKKTGDLLERLTWGFAIAIMVFTLATNFTSRVAAGSGDNLIDKAKQQSSQPAVSPIKATPTPATTPATDPKKP